MRRNPNRGVVLSMADASAIERWLRFVRHDDKFYNPIEAYEHEKAVGEAHQRLAKKLIAIYVAHGSDDDGTGMSADEKAWIG